MPSESAHVKVIARVRPLTTDEVKKGMTVVTKVEGDKVIVQPPGKNATFLLDGGFSADTKNSELFTGKVEPYVNRALEGYNVAILAFGATGAGKSYLMSGIEENPGVVPCLNRSLFKHLGDKSGREYFVTVSYVEILDEAMTDLLNPHTRPMKIRQHPHKGIYVDGLSELVVKTVDDLEKLYDQGNRAKTGGATDVRAHRERANSIFTITVEQKERQSSKVGIRARIQLADLAGVDPSSAGKEGCGSVRQVLAKGRWFTAGTLHLSTNILDIIMSGHLLEVISCLGDIKKKGGHVPYRDSVLTRLLQDALGGNAFTLMLAALSPADKHHQETLTTLEYAGVTKSIKNSVKINLDDTNDIISELRTEISRLRDRIAGTPDPSKDDVFKMEDLVQDLKIAKKQTWTEREKMSAQFEEERKTTLANKGIYEWVMESVQKGNRQIEEKVLLLQKEKDQLTVQYKDKRKLLEELKEDLQKKITDYSKFAETGKASESETKKKVTAIHEIKEKLKRESEAVKQLKQRLREIQEKQKEEKDGGSAQLTATMGNVEVRQKIQKEELAKLEAENRALISEELEKVKVEVDNAKTEIQLRVSDQKGYSAREGADLEIELAELKADKPLITMKLEMLEREKAKVSENLESLYQFHKSELEVQQLQHYQTFRQYREMFEEQKAAIEQRYRQLLEDAVQDAIFLSSRNSELTEENQEQRQQIAEMKDRVTKLEGQLMSSVTG